MSDEKRLRECSVEELQEEMNRRRAEETNASTTLAAVWPTGLEVGVKTARQILSDHCFLDQESSESASKKFPIDLALFLLRKHPELMWEPFHDKSVFAYFIMAGAPLFVMEELCLLWKTQSPPSEEVMEELWKETPPNPIADFCHFGRNSPEVLELLVATFSEHLEARENIDSLTPLEFLLLRCDPGRIYSCMEPKPGFLDAKQMFEILLKDSTTESLPDADDNIMYLETALRGYFGTALSPFLVKALVEHGELDALCFVGGDWELSILLSAAAVLPKMKSFRLDPSSVGDDAFTATMNFIHCCPNGTCLEQLTMPILHESLNQEGKDLIIAALQSCKLLKDLTLMPLRAENDSIEAGEALCLISKDIVGANLGITTLTLARFCLDNGAPLSDLLPVVARSVVKFHVECSIKNDGAYTSSPVGHNSKLESLRLQCTSFRIEWTKAILKQITGLPSLHALTLVGPISNFEVTEEILAILARNRLQNLDLWRVVISWGPAIEALRKNSSLKELRLHCGPRAEDKEKLLNLLKHHNTSLECIKTSPFEDDLDDDILYYTAMNCHGRGQLRAPGAKKHAVVQALCSVLENDCFNRGGVTVQQLQYGLLREAPSTWAN